MCCAQSGQEHRQAAEQEGGGKQFTETWLVLEYCDKGNLQDAVDRGVFVMSRSNAAEQQCNVRSVRCGQMPACKLPQGVIITPYMPSPSRNSEFWPADIWII